MSDDTQDILRHYQKALPWPVREAFWVVAKQLGDKTRSIAERSNLDEEKRGDYLLECMMSLLGITDKFAFGSEMRESLAAGGFKPEQCEDLVQAFRTAIAFPMVREAQEEGLRTLESSPPKDGSRGSGWEFCGTSFDVMRQSGLLRAGKVCWMAVVARPARLEVTARSSGFSVPKTTRSGVFEMPTEAEAKRGALPDLNSLVSQLLRDGWEQLPTQKGEWWDKRFRRPAK
jgi:hypothetical protein